MLQIAAYLRRTGFFVVAALTRPFDFEGRRKLEEADALIEALQDVAQLVVSILLQQQLTSATKSKQALECCHPDYHKRPAAWQDQSRD